MDFKKKNNMGPSSRDGLKSPSVNRKCKTSLKNIRRWQFFKCINYVWSFDPLWIQSTLLHSRVFGRYSGNASTSITILHSGGVKHHITSNFFHLILKKTTCLIFSSDSFFSRWFPWMKRKWIVNAVMLMGFHILLCYNNGVSPLFSNDDTVYTYLCILCHKNSSNDKSKNKIHIGISILEDDFLPH